MVYVKLAERLEAEWSGTPDGQWVAHIELLLFAAVTMQLLALGI
jgi:hypothetical protein